MWHEADFERWFLNHPQLPDGEVLVPIAQQTALRRVVDLLCLDSKGGLVLIEVKNEASSRAIIGQALEYLSQYEDTQLDTLLEDLPTERSEAIVASIQALGWQVPGVAHHRRIYLAAPRFDLPTQSAVTFLNERFSSAGLHLGLLAIDAKDDGFDIRLLEPLRPRTVRDLRGRCGTTMRGRLFLVLPCEPAGIVVNIGSLKDDVLRPPKGATATQRLVWQRTSSLIPYSGGVEVDLTRLGSVWRLRNRSRNAIILATVRTAGKDPSETVYFIVEEGGAQLGYRLRSEQDFRRWWSDTGRVSDEWPDLLSTSVSRRRV